RRIMVYMWVLGGWYGGIKVLPGLLGQELPDDVQITVVDKNPYTSYKTEFHTIVAGTTADVDVRSPFPVHEQVNYEFGTIRSIDLTEKVVFFQDRSTVVNFDYLLFV